MLTISSCEIHVGPYRKNTGLVDSEKIWKIKDNELSDVRGKTRSRRSAPTGVVNSRYELTDRRHESFDPLFLLG